MTGCQRIRSAGFLFEAAESHYLYHSVILYAFAQKENSYEKVTRWIHRRFNHTVS